MKFLHTLIPTLMGVLLASCSSEEPVGAKQGLRLSVPVQLVTSNVFEATSRVTGDPGLDDELAPPSNLYLFAWVQTASSAYELYYTAVTGLTPADWTYTLGSTTEDADSRYQFKTVLDLPFQSSVIAANHGDLIGRIYAIATQRALSETELQTIISPNTSVLASAESVELSASPDAGLRNATLSLADWSSDELRDLYSNPLADTGTDANQIGNGQIVCDSSLSIRARCGTVRLYHCAAKVDFKWEMDASLRDSESVNRIVIRDLPTSCKLFAPTDNPAAETDNVTIPTATDTKWTGREYRYVLQPPTGAISYSVYFNQGRVPTSKVFSPVIVNRTFTGWYRIVARITP